MRVPCGSQEFHDQKTAQAGDSTSSVCWCVFPPAIPLLKAGVVEICLSALWPALISPTLCGYQGLRCWRGFSGLYMTQACPEFATGQHRNFIQMVLSPGPSLFWLEAGYKWLLTFSIFIWQNKILRLLSVLKFPPLVVLSDAAHLGTLLQGTQCCSCGCSYRNCVCFLSF